jgi:predicted  nucleic acid-binding Zn-ribbon protein
MTSRKKTDGERLTQRIAEGLAIDNWIDEIWIAKRIDRLIRKRLREALRDIERLQAKNERLRENVDRLGKEVERADRLREEIARVKADNRYLVNRALDGKP